MIPTPKIWLDNFLNADKTADFLLSGGSLVRFVVVDDESTHAILRDLVRTELKKINFAVFGVPSHIVDIQNPHRVVTAISKKLNLETYIKEFVVRVWHDCGFENPGLSSVRTIAAESGRNAIDLEDRFIKVLRNLLGLGNFSQDTEDTGPHSRHLSRDFANGLRKICIEYMDQGYSPSLVLFTDWLQGESTAATRKMLRIQWPIRKENATSTLRSLMALPSMASKVGAQHSTGNRGGTVLHLDVRWLTDPQSVESEIQRRSSTKTARTSVYQWIRELIDQASEFRSSFIVIEVGPSFVSQDPRGVGIGTYDALKNRILDDVLISGDPNLSAVLVPLAGN
jgi:hypothetical protein